MNGKSVLTIVESYSWFCMFWNSVKIVFPPPKIGTKNKRKPQVPFWWTNLLMAQNLVTPLFTHQLRSCPTPEALPVWLALVSHLRTPETLVLGKQRFPLEVSQLWDLARGRFCILEIIFGLFLQDPLSPETPGSYEGSVIKTYVREKHFRNGGIRTSENMLLHKNSKNTDKNGQNQVIQNARN